MLSPTQPIETSRLDITPVHVSLWPKMNSQLFKGDEWLLIDGVEHDCYKDNNAH